MNTKSTSSSVTDPSSPDEAGSTDESTPKSAIKPFAFPFSPEVFAPGKSNDQPWHQKGNKSNHDQRPGAAPKGSRRSMGKR
ncbi:MAG TPA: hypothetical protein VN303_13500 [Pseudomonas sp.]|nr:hypothetical protein [Pseudomonas sp.]